MKNHDSSVRSITGGDFLSLHEASQDLNVDKRIIMNTVREMKMSVGLLFGKYTVFTKEQIVKLQIILGEAS